MDPPQIAQLLLQGLLCTQFYLLSGNHAYGICSIFPTAVVCLGNDVIQISPVSKMNADISEEMEA